MQPLIISYGEFNSPFALVSSQCCLYFSILLPKKAAMMTTSALGYTAIVNTLEESEGVMRTKFMTANGPTDVAQPLLLFPCCIK